LQYWNFMNCYTGDQRMNHTSILLIGKIRCSYPCYRPWRPIGLREVEAPTFLRQTVNRWRQGCQPYAPTALYHSGFFFLRFDPSAIVRPEGLGKFEKIHFIRKRSRDLPACSMYVLYIYKMWRVRVAPLIIVGSLISYIDLLDPTYTCNYSELPQITMIP
jgi:hypothetical protein